ncbi:hypothetical protein CTAYLR_001144 [Chrysophaeum taylorii]|uniref:Sulfatase N-terminal domain-containing protein n=1 Tax=Chrysophaeum taylorii TaxID=2483200 RepID=A0AAD7UQQ2_9STRA|nr:hypothetical protein CTAYLR_001144 [Chrysophaeum taylorii]
MGRRRLVGGKVAACAGGFLLGAMVLLLLRWIMTTPGPELLLPPQKKETTLAVVPPEPEKKMKMMMMVSRRRIKKKSPRPVIFVVADDLRGDDETLIEARAPNLAFLKREALSFSRAYCQAPACNPSRNSFLTGVMPDVSKVFGFEATTSETLGARGETSFFSVLRSHGYQSFGVGKLYHWEPFGRPFSDNSYFPSTYNQEWGDMEYMPRECSSRGRRRKSNDCHRADVFLADDETELFDSKVTERSLEYLEVGARDYFDDATKTPFVLGVGYHHPHLKWYVPGRLYDVARNASVAKDHLPPIGAPWFAHGDIAVGSPQSGDLKLLDETVVDSALWYRERPTRHNLPRMPDRVQRELRGGYLAAVSFMDEQLGRLLEALVKLELWEDDAIVIFTSDHGYGLGERGHWGKSSLYEIDARVPLYVRDPRSPESRGGVSKALVELVDLTRSIIDLAELPYGPGMYDVFDGRSWKRIVDRKLPDDKWNADRKIAITIIPKCRREYGVPFSCQGKSYAWGSDALLGFAARSAGWRYVAWMPFNKTLDAVDWSQLPVAEELYDHRPPDLRVDDWDHVNLLDAAAAAASKTHRDVANHHLTWLRQKARRRHIQALGKYPFRAYDNLHGPAMLDWYPQGRRPTDRLPRYVQEMR